ncbi:hypothetical protein GUJ93_ZPchr0008g12527 [Zizania palustris]|uniref:non-specific serine/threonine protein kinase n=1 Tax=Zizania palustris TaxID=103762 RepID=A0A8J5V0R2_ZIZPA|nr:hypothetical protein GUJ93_ZPchr0008g12527 [Zizania palustris]
MREFSYEEVEVATGDFSAKNLVGKGSHGSVYKARLKGGAGGRVPAVVAVKRASHSQGEAKLENEIAVLAAARQPGVVNLVGVVAPAVGSKGQRMLVMEYMENGSLHDLLHRSSKPPPWPRRVEIALHVASAVQALHAAEPRVIHRDVKSANILLGRDGRARLADFSLAVKVSTAANAGDGGAPSPDDSAVPAPAPAGTIGYLDPYYTEPGRLGPESDVFSFGVVLLELVSGRKVMDVNASPSSIVAWAVPLVAAGTARAVLDRRIAAPQGADAERAVSRVLAVAARCVSESVDRRPAMAEVVAELHGALESAGWQRHRHAHGRLAGMLYRRVLSCWRLHVRRRVQTSKIVCSEGNSVLTQVAYD